MRGPSGIRGKNGAPLHCAAEEEDESDAIGVDGAAAAAEPNDTAEEASEPGARLGRPAPTRLSAVRSADDALPTCAISCEASATTLGAPLALPLVAVDTRRVTLSVAPVAAARRLSSSSWRRVRVFDAEGDCVARGVDVAESDAADADGVDEPVGVSKGVHVTEGEGVDDAETVGVAEGVSNDARVAEAVRVGAAGGSSVGAAEGSCVGAADSVDPGYATTLE